MFSLLENWLNKNNYQIVIPKDYSIQFNIPVISDNDAKSLFYKEMLNYFESYKKINKEFDINKNQLISMQNSNAWKITLPLRKLLDFLKK